MSVWDAYERRITVNGKTQRERNLHREQRFLMDKLRDSLSYHECKIDGVKRKAAIINSDNAELKSICSLPGEEIRLGCMIEWMGQHWLAIEKDYNVEVYTKCIIQQCNYLLRWIDNDGIVQERWCIIEDGTKLERVIYAIVWRIGNDT